MRFLSSLRKILGSCKTLPTTPSHSLRFRDNDQHRAFPLGLSTSGKHCDPEGLGSKVEWNRLSGPNKPVSEGKRADLLTAQQMVTGRVKTTWTLTGLADLKKVKATPASSDVSSTCHDVWNSIIRETSLYAFRIHSWEGQAAATSAT